MSLAIARLDLAPWGCFAERSLEFALTPGTVELIDGPNAAGKSTISRAEVALLYGIPPRTPDAHTHEYADLRVGAKLIVDGEPLEVIRRKATVGSLRMPDGAELTPDPLPAALGGLTAGIYRGLFQIDNETLVRGGEELLQGKGEVGASLFAAAAGIATLHDRMADFDDRAGQIFRQRASSTLLLRELATLREAERELKQALIRPSRHRTMLRDLAGAEDRCEELSGQVLADIDAHIAEIERQIATAPLLVEHRELSRTLAELGELPRLAAGSEQRRVAAAATLRASGVQRDRQRRERDRLQGALAGVEVDTALPGARRRDPRRLRTGPRRREGGGRSAKARNPAADCSPRSGRCGCDGRCRASGTRRHAPRRRCLPRARRCRQRARGVARAQARR